MHSEDVEEVGLRQATSEDGEFCYRLHKAAMKEYVDAIWGWEERAQREYHERQYDPARWQVITAGGADVGMISVDRHADHIYLGRIEVLPEYQGRGIGTRLIRALVDEAERKGVPFVLDVLVVNRRAYALYQRLGLREVGRHGDGDIKIRMRREPSGR
ncbi:GNAT family N-acetyltransferase [Actinomadura sp. NBRC 104425]|uniref:GNAT family N-acetyltransferase n=1 Tax=Actinomadura sp. NBRC 104425 TaxID=3032204 RepID=UPI0025534409|nr:GNAT family N-acetyltransferase [Actinomadura sp. NBRC 104425]